MSCTKLHGDITTLILAEKHPKTIYNMVAFEFCKHGCNSTEVQGAECKNLHYMHLKKSQMKTSTAATATATRGETRCAARREKGELAAHLGVLEMRSNTLGKEMKVCPELEKKRGRGGVHGTRASRASSCDLRWKNG